MARAHYIVRVGNAGLAPKVSPTAPNHWHYLSRQQLWGFPRDMTIVKVRAKFEADIENPGVTTYIWFLCNSHGGPGHFVQVGIGKRRLGQGPVENGDLPIPEDMMTRLLQGFDHWFEWRHVSQNGAFQEQVRTLPVPHPPYIPTLRRVTWEHPSFTLFEAVLDREEQEMVALATAPPAADLTTAAPTAVHTSSFVEADLENIRREHINPHSQGFIYLIHMEGTTFYKIGMSLDPDIRVRTLQTGNPLPLYLLKLQAVQDMRSAELALHRLFESQRVPNINVKEWFDFGDGPGHVERAFGVLADEDRRKAVSDSHI